jgi:hypothetical protein
MERRSRKRSSSVGSEKVEMHRDKWRGIYCSTGQIPQRGVAPTEEEEEYKLLLAAIVLFKFCLYILIH